MHAPHPSVVRFFGRRLLEISPDLRIVWGEQDYGIERWVVQRQLPPSKHAEAAAKWEEEHPGEDRIFEQKLTDDEGNVIATKRFDHCGEWALARTIEVRDDKGAPIYELEDPRGYRLPDERDIAAIWHWIHDYRDAMEQVMAVRSERATAEEKHKRERIGHIARDIKNSGQMLWGDAFIDSPGKVMEGTEL